MVDQRYLYQNEVDINDDGHNNHQQDYVTNGNEYQQQEYEI
jgi:hypothetical protein